MLLAPTFFYPQTIVAIATDLELGWRDPRFTHQRSSVSRLQVAVDISDRRSHFCVAIPPTV